MSWSTHHNHVLVTTHNPLFSWGRPLRRYTGLQSLKQNDTFVWRESKMPHSTDSSSHFMCQLNQVSSVRSTNTNQVYLWDRTGYKLTPWHMWNVCNWRGLTYDVQLLQIIPFITRTLCVLWERLADWLPSQYIGSFIMGKLLQRAMQTKRDA